MAQDLQDLKARMLRAALSLLRERGPMRRADIPAEVEASVADHPVLLEQSEDAPGRWQRDLRHMLANATRIGWLSPGDDGVVALTDAGAAALDAFADVEIVRELGRLYRRVRQAAHEGGTGYSDPKWTTVVDAASLVGPGEWTTYGDLAEVAGLSPQSVGAFVGEHRVPDSHRILEAGGTVNPSFRWPPPGRPERARAVLEQEGLTFVGARADPSRHLTATDLREALELDDGSPARRAWLVRGSSVEGHDLVPVWLDRGSVSLAASALRPVTPPVPRAELESIVADDYGYKSYAVREAKVAEFDAFCNRMRVGDIVLTTTLGKVYLGYVTGDAVHVASGDGRSNLRRSVEWLNRTQPVVFGQLPAPLPARFQTQNDIVELTEDLATIDTLLVSLGVGPDDPEPEPPALTLPEATEELADELLIDVAWLQEQIDLLWDRKQIIFYGPPGTGKTYVARRLVAHLTEPSAVNLVQFHPSYTYEDFFEGFRPAASADGQMRFDLRPGPFRRLVESAAQNPSQPHVLIIDEINRANLAKVFGELYFLLEYRDAQIELLYSSEDFRLPPNVFVIGTMNTADRSIAPVDAAMRRRFGFVELHPQTSPTHDVLPRWLARLREDEDVEYALDAPRVLDALNARIPDRDLALGPSYLMRPEIYRKADGLERTWRSAILPLLAEYHAGEPAPLAEYELVALRAALRESDAP